MSTPPFRADHVGSLLRPKKLREAFRTLSGSALRAVQDECIREVVRLQKDCGLDVLTDGEFRRISYWEKFVRLTRLEVRDAVFTFHDAEGHEAKFTAPITVDELGFGNNKVTMPAPSTAHFYRFTDWGGAYKDAAEFFRDLGKVYQAEIAELARAGCRYVQIDEVALAILCDAGARDKVRAAGEDPERLVDLYIDVPSDKGVVLGLVSSKTAEEAARFVSAERLAISPQCGFASTIGGNPVTEQDERAKRRLCVEAARQIWG